MYLARVPRDREGKEFGREGVGANCAPWFLGELSDVNPRAQDSFEEPTAKPASDVGVHGRALWLPASSVPKQGRYTADT